MSFSSFLCHIGLHRWRSESEAKRYRHNTYWNKTQNRLDAAKPLIKVCTKCGTKRIWSFNRGKWRKYEERERVDTSAAWNVEPAEENAEAVSQSAKPQA